MSNIQYEKQGHIAVVTFDRPKQLNALSSEVLDELSNILREIDIDPEVYVAIFTGAGRSFIAGADIDEMMNLTERESRRFSKLGNEIFLSLENLSKPTIAAINGYALGGGNELAMCCDIRIASEKAKFGHLETTYGIIPGFGGTQRLARLIGMSKAKELIFTGDVITAADALEFGLVSYVVPAEELMDKAFSIAEKICSKAQIAVRQAKRAIEMGMQCDINTAVICEAEAFALCFTTEDQKDAMAAFVKKEPIAPYKNK